MSDTIVIDSLDDVLTGAPFRERHTRRVDLPMAEVWPALLACELDEIAVFGPLMRLRTLPGRLLGRETALDQMPSGPMLDMMTETEFRYLRRDEEPVDGRGLVMFGAIGQFWKPVGNKPIDLDSLAEHLAFNEPNHAIIAASLEAVDHGDHVELITETRVKGTDAGANRKFAPYWALIRLPSGFIRRCWLAAIERTARGESRNAA